MPLPNVHSISAGIAGFVIAAYWVAFVVIVAATYSAHPSALEAAGNELVNAQVCELDVDPAVACGSGGMAAAAATAATRGHNAL
jgi:hypothetical protein